MRIGNRQLLGVSLVSVGTLAFEIVMTRIFSVMMWYHFAFLAISLALMGSATAGVFLYWHPELIEPRRARPWISRLSLLLALSAPLSLWVYLQVPFAPALMNRTAWFSPLKFFWLAIIFLNLAVPFFLSGLVLALALSTWAAESGRVYWADLSGAAVGCLLSIAALELFGAAGAVLAITVILALAAVIFALGRDVGRVTQRLVLGGMTVTLLLTAVQAVTPWLKITPGRLDQPPQYEHWSANAQVTVYEPANYRFFWSVSPSQWERTIAEGGSFPHTLLLIDAVAGTPIQKFDGDLYQVRFLHYDLTSIVYHLLDAPRTLVIGPGGGRDVLAARPLLVGFQIAFIGTLLRLPLGLAFTRLFSFATEELAPMPEFAGTLVHPPSFLLASALGIVLPLLATLIPVWQAVRAQPLDALHGHLAAKSSGLNQWLKGLRLPGDTFAQLPLKNVLRSPKRTLLTVLGVAVAIALLFLFLGLRDTLIGTLDQAEQALLYRSPDRIVVSLNTFYPTEHEQVRRVAALSSADGRPLFAEAEPGLRIGGRLQAGDREIESPIEFVPADSAIWTPALLAGRWGDGEGRAGIVISRKAADDLGLGVGESLIIEHPFHEEPYAFRTVSTALNVAGIHDNPLRGLSYMALEEAAFTGLDGLTNALVANSGHEATLEQIRRQLFARPAVLAVAAVADLMASFDPSLDILVYSLSIMQVATLFIAFLIAFNLTSINIDDRIREVATMFAFGARPRTVTWVQIGENALLGVLGTAVGGVVGAVISIVFQLRHFKTGRQLNATPRTVTSHLGHADRSYPDAPSAQKAWATQAVSRPLDGQSSDRHDHSPSLHRLQLVSLSGTGDSLDSAATRSAL
jgi:ABC-type lipoprotein release transport system permease subunit